MLSRSDTAPSAGSPGSRAGWERFGVFAATFLICMAWAAVTNHAWEDWYITFRASKNLALGYGLTFTAGEPPLHSFTSPLGTTIPALCSLLAGPENDALALWYYRVFSAALLGLAAMILFDFCRQYRYGPWATAALLGSFMLESKTIDHTINGMETGLMMFFIALTIRAHVHAARRPWLNLGLAWGGLMWSRPDGCVYGAAVSIAFFLFSPQSALGINRAAMLRNLGKAALVCAAVYLPWFAGAWLYYGSPIPNTIKAKALDSSHQLELWDLLKDFLLLPFKGRESFAATWQSLAPSYALVFGGWPDAVYLFSRILTTLACYYWLVPFASRFGRSLSFAALLTHFYLSDVTPHAMPWYLPNAGVFALLTVAAMFHDGFRLADRFREELPRPTRSWRLGLQCLIGVQLTFFLAMFIATGWQSYWQQRLVEDGVRTQIGLWLKEHAKSPRDTVLLECLGYIGFFSGLKMYDYPGMGTPETIAARKKLRQTHGPYGSWAEISNEQKIALIREMKPDWLVLRGYTANSIRQTDPKFLTEEYEVRHGLSVSDQVKQIPWLPGRMFLEIDATFIVFGRKAGSAAE